MKEYRGIVRIECTRTGGCLRNLKKNVQAGCIGCPEAVTRIVDLEDKTIYEYRSPDTKTGKRAAKTRQAEE